MPYSTKEKQREYDKKYRELNKEKKRECNRKYRELNKEKIADYRRKHREENVVIEDIIPKVLKERSTISVVNKQGDTIGYITANELSDALTKH